MSLTDFLRRYTDDVYMARDPEAARQYIADPCLRHEHGHLVTMSIDENVARVRDFLARATTMRFDNVVVVQDDAHVASAYDITFGNGDALQTVSGIEIFRVVEGKITETWNSSIQAGAWG
ncbi:MAG: ester cyclase [Ilumatobacteraceae bacterium]|jgi:predicted SnoaL-like aldol condensation-catalyzing enzyme|nr:ester cyclase [Ilumatobacteraceae bacterium]